MSSAQPLSEQEFFSEFSRIAPALHVWASLRVHGAARRRIDPEDLVQSVGLHAFASLPSFDPSRGPFRAWVFGVANLTLKRFLVDLYRGPPIESQAGGASDQTHAELRVRAETTSVSRKAARSEEVQALVSRAAALGEEAHQLLICRGLMGMSHDDVAGRLGVSVAVAEKRWQRLREKLAGNAGLGLLHD